MNMFQPKNILITGGSGFIGLNFLMHYKKKFKAASIINLDANTYAAHPAAKNRCTAGPTFAR